VKKLRNKNQKGFTLIELLVVIAIIGLLASVVLLALNSARAKSRDAKRLADMRQMSTALELYYNDQGGYPITANLTTGLVPTYVGAIPTAPVPPETGCTAAQNTYTYTGTGTSYTGTQSATVVPSYTYTFCLGGQTGGFAAGVHTASQTGIQ
jgi:general secretion pathway protein G